MSRITSHRLAQRKSLKVNETQGMNQMFKEVREGKYEHTHADPIEEIDCDKCWAIKVTKLYDSYQGTKNAKNS